MMSFYGVNRKIAKKIGDIEGLWGDCRKIGHYWVIGGLWEVAGQ